MATKAQLQEALEAAVADNETLANDGARARNLLRERAAEVTALQVRLRDAERKIHALRSSVDAAAGAIASAGSAMAEMVTAISIGPAQ